MDLICRTLSDKKQEELAAIVEEMGRYHPDEPHWYLPWVGVDPALQSRGYGSALLEYGLRDSDRDGIPAYLEASSLESIPLYRRHDFEVLGTIQVGTAPPVTQ